MNSEALFLFLILLLGLVLCSFLGGNCNKEGFNTYTPSNENDNHYKNDQHYKNDHYYGNKYDNYNHYNGSSSELPSGTVFNGPNGGTVVITTDNNGKQSLKVILKNGDSPIILSPSESSSVNSTTTTYNSNSHNGSVTTYYGENGVSATIVTIDGRQAIKVTTKNGTTVFTEQGPNSNNNNSISSSQYYGSTGNRVYPNNESNSNTNTTSYGGPYGGSYDSVRGPRTTAARVSYNAHENAESYFDPYNNALPPGIPASQIPRGHEDLYILKSEVVPPVCPVCPSTCNSSRKEPCPACPPCGRCPEPSFECKKVPNYNAINDSYLPAPVLNDFSSFGM